MEDDDSTYPEARRPWQLGRTDWREVLGRVWRQRAEDELSARAAAVAFSAMFAIPTLLIAVVSLYGIFASPSQVTDVIDRADSVLPDAATELLAGQLTSLVAQNGGALSLAALLGLIGAVWSVSGGVNRVRHTINQVYGEDDDRPWYVKRAWSAVASIVGIVVIVAAIGLIALMPAVLGWLDVTGGTRTLLILGRWVVLGALLLGVLGALYRLGPKRQSPRVPWITVGSALAALAWLAMSIGFGTYAQNFASYNETYGSLGAVIALMTWLYLSAYIILLAGELNSELEHQTMADTTVGGDQPLGRRGAFVADTVPDEGPAPVDAHSAPPSDDGGDEEMDELRGVGTRPSGTPPP